MPSPVPRDPHQREIARQLKFIGGAPSTYFRDACELMDRPTEPRGSVTHLVAHPLRETEALREALREMVGL